MAGSGSLRAYVITRVIFFILRVAPGDPVSTIFGEKGNPVLINQIKQELGLNDPLPIQYLRYLVDVFTGHMGTSIVTTRPVIDEIGDRMPATIELTLSAMVVAVSVGIFLGVVAGTHRNKPVDFGARLF